jgi:hypothetical protein
MKELECLIEEQDEYNKNLREILKKTRQEINNEESGKTTNNLEDERKF